MDILENLEGGDCNTPKTVADRLEKLQLDDRAARNRTEASVTSLKKLVVDRSGLILAHYTVAFK